MKKKEPQITEAEWPIMDVLWNRGDATSAEIVAEVAKVRKASMRTIKTLLRRLIEKNIVSYVIDEKDSRIYHYSATVSKDRTLSEKSTKFAELFYGNNIGSLLSHFLESSDLRKEEIERLEKMLEDKKGERRS